ncbi:hypothetical protein COOONC_02303 [Cooperia oncophora]
MRFLNGILSDISVYAQSFKMMHDVEQAASGTVSTSTSARELEQRQHDLPTANEIAVIIRVKTTMFLQIEVLQSFSSASASLMRPVQTRPEDRLGQGGWEPASINTAGARITQKEYYCRNSVMHICSHLAILLIRFYMRKHHANNCC